MRKTISIILSISVLICLMGTVIAGPVSEKDITLNIKVPQVEFIANGNWKMSFVSIGEFEKDGWNFEDYSILEKYATHKQNCGADNTFYQEVYEMSPEESKHKGCVINGTYQERFCFRTTSKEQICKELAEYKIDYNKQLTFESYYNSYMWDINRSEQYHHFEAPTCTITNNTCEIKIKIEAEPYNPYIVVLEKMNSSEVYFSQRVNIEQMNAFYNQTLFDCFEIGCDVHENSNLTINKIELLKQNQLKIEFEKNANKEQNKKTKFQIVIMWLKNLF